MSFLLVGIMVMCTLFFDAVYPVTGRKNKVEYLPWLLKTVLCRQDSVNNETKRLPCCLGLEENSS